MTPLLALILLALFAYPQGDTGQLSGTIFDANNAAIQNANIKLTNHATSQLRELSTNDSGNFAFTLLPPGRYKIEVTATGFTTVHMDDVRINITQTTSITVHLDPATVQSVVTVNADASLVQQESSQVGRVIEGQTIRQLPLPTRNFQQLLTLLRPGEELAARLGESTIEKGVPVCNVRIPGVQSFLTTGDIESRLDQYFILRRSCCRDRSSGAGISGMPNNPTFDPNNPFGDTPRNFCMAQGRRIWIFQW